MPPENKEVSLSDLAAALEDMNLMLHVMSGQLSRLAELGEKAEKFLHNPIGAYKAARLGKLPSRD